MKIQFKLLIISILVIHFTNAQNLDTPLKKTQNGFAKVDFLSINMPLNEADMGFTGIHYNLEFDQFYAGAGLYGAVSGIRGGFFTLGVNAGLKHYFSDQFFTDLGFHFGGGGGAAAPDGGGAFFLPHANIGYQFKNFRIQTGWSYVNFFDKGDIKSHQLNFGIEIPINFDYASYQNRNKTFTQSELATTKWNQKSNKNSLFFHLNNLKIRGRTQNTGGVKYNGETIRLAGFEFASYLNDNWFGFLKVDGAYHGIQSGYMDVFLGGGYHYHFNQNRTGILAKFAIGAGGGGGLDTEGGVLLQPDLSIEQKLFDDVFIAVNKGYVFSPNGHVNTSSYGLGIKYYVDRNGIFNDDDKFNNFIFKGINVIVKQELYVNAKRWNNVSEDLQQISLQVNFDVSNKLYLAGETSFANFGDAGAYAEGLVGAGLKLNPNIKNINFFGQFLAGAAGGGAVSTGQGLIIKPSIGLTYDITDELSARTAAGYVKAKGGELSNPFFNLGLQYNISFLKKR